MAKKQRYGILGFLTIVLVVILMGCSTIQPQISFNDGISPKEHAEQKIKGITITEETERDNIFMMLAYAIVYKDWQTEKGDDSRGYNIGCVMVEKGDEDYEIVAWGRNCVNEVGSKTQHGEVRLIYYYLQKNDKKKDLKGDFTIYTTLEPCAMCSGMMVLNSLKRTVWGQYDPDYGQALERLAFDSSQLNGGFKSYPRKVESNGAEILHRYWLESEFKKYMKEQNNNNITEFLASEEAKAVYRDAENTLMNYEVIFKENLKHLEKAREYYETVPAEYVNMID